MNVAVKVGNIAVTQDEVVAIIFGLKLGLPEGQTTSKLIQQMEMLEELLNWSPR
jgi:hypothetical protein